MHTGSSSANTLKGESSCAYACQKERGFQLVAPIHPYKVGPVRVGNLAQWPKRSLQWCPNPASEPIQADPSLPGALLGQGLLPEEHFKTSFLFKELKLKKKKKLLDTYFVLCLKHLALILFHALSMADWALLSSTDSSSAVGNSPAFAEAGSLLPPPPSQHSFQSR